MILLGILLSFHTLTENEKLLHPSIVYKPVFVTESDCDCTCETYYLEIDEGYLDF